jgi:hypothetical protein
MDTIFEEQLTLYAEDSPVKTYQPQASKLDLVAKDQAYTGKCLELLASVCPDTQFLKTSQGCLLETEVDGSQNFSMTWPRSGSMQNGTVSQLLTLGRTTTEIGSGLYAIPTPTVAWSAPNKNANTKGPKSTQEFARMYPTQTVSSRIWPTPAAHEARLGWQDRTVGKKGTQESLSTLVMKSEGREGSQEWNGGQLNPVWVEWLMGFPIGHTDLNN